MKKDSLKQKPMFGSASALSVLAGEMKEPSKASLLFLMSEESVLRFRILLQMGGWRVLLIRNKLTGGKA
jgi:hypothetical protein